MKNSRLSKYAPRKFLLMALWNNNYPGSVRVKAISNTHHVVLTAIFQLRVNWLSALFPSSSELIPEKRTVGADFHKQDALISCRWTNSAKALKEKLTGAQSTDLDQKHDTLRPTAPFHNPPTNFKAKGHCTPSLIFAVFPTLVIGY